MAPMLAGVNRIAGNLRIEAPFRFLSGLLANLTTIDGNLEIVGTRLETLAGHIRSSLWAAGSGSSGIRCSPRLPGP